MAELSKAELAALTLTADLWNSLSALGDHHPSDMAEHQRSIHDIQARVMARLARRVHPAFFTAPAAGVGVPFAAQPSEGSDA